MDVEDAHGWTSLSWASANGHLGVVQAFLDRVAELKAAETSGEVWQTVSYRAGREKSPRF
jgi:ankyrin repeat protein